jgi:hypothetical protein
MEVYKTPMEQELSASTSNEQVNSDQYYHYSFTELTNPELVDVALRVHAEGYTAMGFVSSDAVDPDGKLTEQIDHSRGDNVDYFLLVDRNDTNNKATIRKINLAPEDKVNKLPGYSLTESGLYPHSVQHLSQLSLSGYEIKELSGLARTAEAPPVMIYAILKDVLHSSLSDQEAWFFSIVSNTLNSLTKYLGKSAFKILGEEVRIKDYRVQEQVVLVPAIFMPDQYLDNLIDDIEGAETPQASQKLLSMFLFVSEGLGEKEMSAKAYDYRQRVFEFLNNLEK